MLNNAPSRANELLRTWDDARTNTNVSKSFARATMVLLGEAKECVARDRHVSLAKHIGKLLFKFKIGSFSK
jgi:hypothetical protein